MDFKNIQKAQHLSLEKAAIQEATMIFDQGGSIVSMGLAPKPMDMPGGMSMPRMPTVNVPTEYIEYPPQMVDAIKSAFTARLTAIDNELKQIGVTGV